MLALEALHEEAKPLKLQISWTKTRVQVFGGLLDDTVQSIHACFEDTDILEDFINLGSVTQSSGSSGHEVLRQTGLVHAVTNPLDTSI